MSNPDVDHQVQMGLRDDRRAERFAEQMAELAAQIVNSTFQFAQDVKTAYESSLIPKKGKATEILTKPIKPGWRWARSASLCMFLTGICFGWTPKL